MLTTKEAGAALGMTPRAVAVYIARGHIRAQKFGRDWMIDPAEVERFLRERPRVGWPKGKPRKG